MEIPRFHWNSTEVESYLKRGLPVVLLECPLSLPNANRWTVDYLSTIVDPTFTNDVYVSESQRFLYWDDSKNIHGYKYQKPTIKTQMTFADFRDSQLMGKPRASDTSESTATVSGNTAAIEEGDVKDAASIPAANTLYRYLQQGVVQEMGVKMIEEYSRFSLEAALKFKIAADWDAFSTNLLLCGSKGAVTPCHYDEQENLFAQLSGRKHVRLFSPDDWARLYPYPMGHPFDRQCRITLPAQVGAKVLDTPEDQERFPAFSLGEGPTEMYADLGPGEMVYIPQYWFHQMEALEDNVSLSWWFKNQNRQKGKTDIDINTIALTAIRRNLEKMISDSIPQGKVQDFFVAVAGGKLPIPSEEAVNAMMKQARAAVQSTAAKAEESRTSSTGGSSSSSVTSDGNKKIIKDGDSTLTINSSPKRLLNPPMIKEDAESAANIDIPQSWSSVIAQSVYVASIVLQPGESIPFLKELASGRFHSL